jgi:hypothetical protein
LPALGPPAAGSARAFGAPMEEGDDESASARRDGDEEADP